MNTKERISELERLKVLFQSMELPKGPIVLEGFMTLHHLENFIGTNLKRGQLAIDSSNSETCMLRLQKLESYLKNIPVQQ